MSNFEIFKDRLDFSDSDNVYIMMALPRKKDGFPVFGDKYSIRKIITNLEDYTEYFNELIGFIGYRIYITYNPRSLRKAYREMQSTITDKILLGGYDDANNYLSRISSEYKSILMKPTSKAKTKYFMYDIDGDNPKAVEALKMLEEFEFELPSKNGVHIFTRPFNPKDFDHNYYAVEYKNDALTNLVF